MTKTILTVFPETRCTSRYSIEQKLFSQTCMQADTLIYKLRLNRCR